MMQSAFKDKHYSMDNNANIGVGTVGSIINNMQSLAKFNGLNQRFHNALEVLSSIPPDPLM